MRQFRCSTDGFVSPFAWAIPILLCLLLVADPVLANKFETIGSGISGSVKIKREWLVLFFLSAGGVSLLFAVLAVFMPHKNALFLNFSNWKQSAIVLSVIATCCFVAAALV